VAAAPLTVIIGAGVSGLTCAYALKKSGQNVVVLEASGRSGGYIETVEENGFLFELGPQSFSGTEPLFKLCEELGISHQLVEAPHGAPRYIVIEGKLVPVPLSPGAFLASSLLSWKTKFSIVADVFRTSVPPDTDESVATFVRTKFTPELLDRLVGPFVSGIYAGDPEKLSLQAAFPKIHEAQKLSGSIIRGSLRLAKSKTVTQQNRGPGLYSFQKGTATLTQAIADFLGIALRYNAKVAQEIRRDDDCFVLTIESNSGLEEIRPEKLVLATPTGVNANLLRLIAPAATFPSFDIEYAPVAVVSHGYHKDQVGNHLSGFGFLIPGSEKMQTLGTVWNSSLFAGRSPANHVLMTSFIGGACTSNRERLSEVQSAEIVRREVGSLLRISGSPVVERVADYGSAIPQYNVGHTQRLQTIREAAGKVPGLWLTGNYWKGPSVGACVEHALAVAEEIRTS
jgi:oxygen-dependent protoporphyrinogen oxidase